MWTSRNDNSLCLSFCCLFLLLLNLILFLTSLQLPITYTPGSPWDGKIPTAVQGFWCYQSKLTSLFWKICLLSLLLSFIISSLPLLWSPTQSRNSIIILLQLFLVSIQTLWDTVIYYANVLQQYDKNVSGWVCRGMRRCVMALMLWNFFFLNEVRLHKI